LRSTVSRATLAPRALALIDRHSAAFKPETRLGGRHGLSKGPSENVRFSALRRDASADGGEMETSRPRAPRPDARSPARQSDASRDPRAGQARFLKKVTAGDRSHGERLM